LCQARRLIQQVVQLRGEGARAVVDDSHVEEGSDRGRADRAAQAAGENDGRRGAPPHRPLDAILYDRDRGDAEEAHARTHQEGAAACNHRAALGCQE
jgi:hypothetical protein